MTSPIDPVRFPLTAMFSAKLERTSDARRSELAALDLAHEHAWTSHDTEVVLTWLNASDLYDLVFPAL